MKKPRISVIIPVFNKEKYIGKCIESVISQTYENIELILIDDGSKDNSLSICRKYAENDGRINVIHQDNKGQSIARNVGIDAASGEWFIAPDSDDWLDAGYIQDLVEYAVENKLDCSIGNCKRVEYDTDGNITNIENRQAFNREFITDDREMISMIQANACAARVNSFLINKEFQVIGMRSVATPWDKLYNMKIVKNHQLKYIPGLGSREDIVFSLNYLEWCNRVGYLYTYGYNYRVLPESISHGFNMNIVSGDINTFNEFMTYINRTSNIDQLCYVRQGIFVAVIRMLFDDFKRWFFCKDNPASEEEKNDWIKEIEDNPLVRDALRGIDKRNLSEREYAFLQAYNNKDFERVKKIIEIRG